MREREGGWFRFLLLGQVLRVFGRRRGDINGEFFFISTFFFFWRGEGGFMSLLVEKEGEKGEYVLVTSPLQLKGWDISENGGKKKLKTSVVFLLLTSITR